MVFVEMTDLTYHKRRVDGRKAMCGTWDGAYKDDWKDVDCGRCLRIGKQPPKFTRIRIRVAKVDGAPANFRKLIFDNCTECKFAKDEYGLWCIRHKELREHIGFQSVCDDFEL